MALLRLPYTIIMGFIVIFASVGAYSVNNNFFDVWMMLGFAVLGYLMRKLNYPIVPLGFGLGSWEFSRKLPPSGPHHLRRKFFYLLHPAHLRSFYHCCHPCLPHPGDPMGI